MKSLLETIGHTPLIQLGRSVPDHCAAIYAKLESFNPGGSVKDRICLSMIEAAEKTGELQKGATVVEPTSGNTGIGLALVCSIKKHPLILVMPENYSIERRYLMQEMGAKLVLTPASEKMQGAIHKAEEIASEIPGAFLPRQFENPFNVWAHETGTAREILADLPADSIDAFVAGVGTGGTITGVGKVLKKLNPRCQIIAVEPEKSAVLSGAEPGAHRIQGIGAGFVPKILNRDLLDRVIAVSDEDAMDCSRTLSKKEGILVGISSGAAFCASLQVARELGNGKKVVTVFPDKGERYFSVEKYF